MLMSVSLHLCFILNKKPYADPQGLMDYTEYHFYFDKPPVLESTGSEGRRESI